jgi:AcrR family transcriptional regulator
MCPQNKTSDVNRVPRRAQKDPPGEATRAALIEKAEAMFAEKGIDAVSLRQIGIAAGSANANVVGYHFGSKDALVKATLLRNRPQIEARRVELLDQAKREGREHDLSALMEALCRPIFELRNADGRHTYAIFLWHISRSHWWERLSYVASFPATQEIMKRVATVLSGLPDTLFMERIRVVGDVVTGVLQRLDSHHKAERIEELLFVHALQMAKAVLNAPIGKEDPKALRRCNTRASGMTKGDPVFG